MSPRFIPRVLFVVLLAMLMTSCVQHYTFQRQHLREAEKRWMSAPMPIAVPAIDDNGDKVYVDMAYVRYIVSENEKTDEAVVAVRDIRPLLWGIGIPLMALGTTILALSIKGGQDKCKERNHGDDADCIFATPFLQGVFFGISGAIGGLTMTIIGFANQRPEMSGPAPGFHRHEDGESESSETIYGLKAMGRF